MRDLIIVSIAVFMFAFCFAILFKELSTVQPNVHKILTNK